MLSEIFVFYEGIVSNHSLKHFVIDAKDRSFSPQCRPAFIWGLHLLRLLGFKSRGSGKHFKSHNFTSGLFVDKIWCLVYLFQWDQPPSECVIVCKVDSLEPAAPPLLARLLFHFTSRRYANMRPCGTFVYIGCVRSNADNTKYCMLLIIITLQFNAKSASVSSSWNF